MFGTNEFTSATHVVDVDARRCPESGATRATVRIRPLDGSVRTVYVGHPISGIRVGRIAAMQDEVERTLAEAGRRAGLRTVPLFPMRTPHLASDEVGASEYEEGASLFSDTRHFTFQNRLDALVGAGLTEVKASRESLPVRWPSLDAELHGLFGTPFGPVVDRFDDDRRAALMRALRLMLTNGDGATVDHVTTSVLGRAVKPSRAS